MTNTSPPIQNTYPSHLMINHHTHSIDQVSLLISHHHLYLRVKNKKTYAKQDDSISRKMTPTQQLTHRGLVNKC